jgi:hypothetical protein
MALQTLEDQVLELLPPKKINEKESFIPPIHLGVLSGFH